MVHERKHGIRNLIGHGFGRVDKGGLKHLVQRSKFERVELLCLIHYCSSSLGLYDLSPNYRSSNIQVVRDRGYFSNIDWLCVGRQFTTLASAISNLTLAFTFILALIIRMEKLSLRSSSTQAKIMGTVVSILVQWQWFSMKALQSYRSHLNHHPFHLSLLNWVIGGLLLAVEYLLLVHSILQIQVMRILPSELIVVFVCNLFATVISEPVSLMLDMNLSGWRLRADIALMAIASSRYWSNDIFNLILICHMGKS
ncbi:wat1-related protein [Quercus suber]|uniref:Wat1-related protein n=1 Tax=Quercus suber TaxID=58331 RepID=A0AAW0MCF1_QUESU